MSYTYGTRVAPVVAAVKRVLSQNTTDFPVVGNGLGGLPRRVQKQGVQKHRYPLGVTVSGNNIVYFHKSPTDYQLSTAIQILFSYTGSESVVTGESADGLTMYAAVRLSASSGALVYHCLKRQSIVDRWEIVSTQTTSVFTSTPVRILVSHDGRFALVQCQSASVNAAYAAVLIGYDGSNILTIKEWMFGGINGATWPIAAMSDVKAGRFYCFVFGVASSFGSGNRPELGYMDYGSSSWKRIAFDNELSALGNFGSSAWMSFYNTQLGFVWKNGGNIDSYIITDSGIVFDKTLVGGFLTNPNAAGRYGIVVGSADDYLIAPALWSGTFYIEGAYLNKLSGLWQKSNFLLSNTTGWNAVAVSPEESRLMVSDSSTTYIYDLTKDAVTGELVRGSLITSAATNSAQFKDFSSGVQTSYKVI